ncbi:hypothetical protein CYY_004541 [Polysphondylium violaceum]|uniref:Translation elongation factor EF1B beta/delta subunit guanine nucleotide exchange domain-containing protein n=1 Tax=Polysphondylium violaceum TaxID=133409 RepID=A0A8J4PUF8_9MYCE|nr:hypothetical protein CYY_004541 [Polysphondylium violaceum]
MNTSNRFTMPSFTDLKTEAGLAELNTYLADKTYIVGFVPSSADVEALALVGTCPCNTKFVNVCRWFRTISDYTAEEKAAFPKTEAVTVKAAAAPAAAKDEDDVDLFGSDEDDEEYEKQLAERAAAAKAKKAAKPAVIAKSSILLDVKPWDDTTPMDELEKSVRSIEMEGLIWGASKLIAVGYGIRKLNINVVVEDDKVSMDDLEEQIVAFEDYVQSVDVVAFNKI